MKVFFILFGLSAMIAGIYDFLFYRIPNVIVGFIFLLFFVMVILTGTNHLNIDLAITAIVFCAGLSLYFMNYMGAGDVKFLTAATLWAAHAHKFGFFLIAVTLIGGLIAVIYVLIPVYVDWLRIRLISLLSVPLQKLTFFMRYAEAPFQAAYHETKHKTPIPYGVAIVFASIYIVYFVLTGQVSYEG